MRLYQHLTVLSQYIFALVCHPVGIAVSRLGTWNVRIGPLLISIIVALPFVVIAVTVLNTYIEIAIILIGAIHITNIATTEDITISLCHFLRRTYGTTIDVYLGLSEDVTIGVERTAVT